WREGVGAERGPLTLGVGPGGAPAERARKLGEELGEIRAGLRVASEGYDVASSDAESESAREAALTQARDGAEQMGRHARRAEGLLGERHREALRARLEAGEALLDDVRAVRAAAEAAGAAIRATVEQ